MDRQGGGWSVAVSRLQTCSSLSPSPPLLLIKLDGSTPKQLIPSRPLPGTGLPRSLNSLNAEQKIPPRPRSGSPEVNSSRRRPSLSQSLSRHVGAISSSPDPRGGRTRGADWPGIAGRTSSRLLIGRVPWRGLPFPPPRRAPGGNILPAKLGGASPGPGAPGGGAGASADPAQGSFQPPSPASSPSWLRLPRASPPRRPPPRRRCARAPRPAPRAPRPAPHAPPRAPGLAAAAALLFPPRRDRGGGGVRARARGLPPPGPLGSSTPLPAPGWGGRAGGGSPSALRPRGCPRGHAPRGSGLSDGVAAWAPGEGGMARGLRSAPPRPAVGEGPSD